MPISPSRRQEIQGLVARLASADAEEARVAAARLLVIGPRAFSALRDMVEAGEEPGARRALDLVPFLREARAVDLLAARLGSEDEGVAATAAELLACEGSPAAAEALGRAFAARRAPCLLAALEVMAARGAPHAEKTLAHLLGDPDARPDSDWAALTESLGTRVEARAEEPLQEGASTPGDVPATARPERSALDGYLGLEPEAPDELEARRRTAAAPGIDEAVAAMLPTEEDPRRLSLLALLASESREPRLIMPLLQAIHLLQGAARRDAAKRADVIAAEARAHMALARHGSRAAIAELSQSLRGLAPAEIRVEHLGALELVGSRADLPAVVELCAHPDWLGDTALRVAAVILRREGLTTRAAALRKLSPERRKALREILAGGAD